LRVPIKYAHDELYEFGEVAFSTLSDQLSHKTVQIFNYICRASNAIIKKHVLGLSKQDEEYFKDIP